MTNTSLHVILINLKDNDLKPELTLGNESGDKLFDNGVPKAVNQKGRGSYKDVKKLPLFANLANLRDLTGNSIPIDIGIMMNIWSILQHASPVNQAILFFLLAMSIFSWIIIIERWRFFASSKKADARFFDSLRGNLDANKIHSIALEEVKSTSGRVYLGAEREVERLGRENAETWSEALDIERNLLRSEGERGLSFLAIIASSAPFIGLLGTVWGVMIAFLKLGAVEGQPALEVVGPGIAEALIATAMGLFAAIPATMAYNALLVSQRKLLRRSEEFSRRLVATIRPDEGFGR